MNETKILECTKSEFLARLTAEFVEPVRGTNEDTLALREVLSGLAVQADQHRGVFTGHSEYLDLDYTVWPDTIKGIAAMTDAQRTEARNAAYTTASHVSTQLGAAKGFIDLIERRLAGRAAGNELTPAALDTYAARLAEQATTLTRLIDALNAAAGHLRLAEQDLNLEIAA